MSDNAKQTFAENLKRYLKDKGLTQLDLAVYMECSSSTVSDWCNGKKYPRVDKMQRMADYLGIRSLTGEPNLHYLTLFDPISARLAQYLPNLNSAKCRNCALNGALYARFRLLLFLDFI